MLVSNWVGEERYLGQSFVLSFLQHNDSLILQPLSQSYFRTFLHSKKESLCPFIVAPVSSLILSNLEYILVTISP